MLGTQSAVSGTQFAKTRKAEHENAAKAIRIKQQLQQTSALKQQHQKGQSADNDTSPTAKLRNTLAKISKFPHLPTLDVHLPQLHLPANMHLPSTITHLSDTLHLPASINQMQDTLQLSTLTSKLRTNLNWKNMSLFAFPFGRGRLRGPMSWIPAAFISIMLVLATTAIGIITSNFNLATLFNRAGFGQLIGLGNRYPTKDYYAFNIIHTLLRGGAGGGNWAWSRMLSKPFALHGLFPWSSNALVYGWYAADALLAASCFLLLTNRRTLHQSRYIALGAFIGLLGIKSLWGICRIGMRSLAINFGFTAVQLLAITGAAIACYFSDRRAAALMGIVATWAAVNCVDAGAIWYLNH